MLEAGCSAARCALSCPPPPQPGHGSFPPCRPLPPCSNYAACIVQHPGPVPQLLHQAALDSGGRVRRGALDGCRLCYECGYFKPPAAHHCRSCGCCVVEMDHHCWWAPRQSAPPLNALCSDCRPRRASCPPGPAVA
jgi:hypothetical protein